MCRIAGIWSPHTSGGIDKTCVRMRDTLTHGGPDDAGVFFDHTSGLAFGHRRLSIIDLTKTGHQPMSTSDGRYTICYNGEVYNYKELRRELEGKDFTFRGTSDTEVVLNAFASWGPTCVERLIGMFAFTLWDSAEKALYLFRDRIGVKPLYYYRDRENFAFASELKALHAGLRDKLSIDIDALGEFFHYGYIAGNKSIFHHVSKLEPGCWIKVNSSFSIEKHHYWDPAQLSRSGLENIDEEVLTDRLDEILIDAFTRRLIADVPVGVFLSGGIDSSLVTAILARHTDTPVKTFTIGFHEKNYDESVWAKKVADHLGTEHTCEIVTPEHAKEILPLWPEIYDEPFGDISGIPTTIVSRMTQKHVKVSLSADGGDELFCGYHRYWVMDRLQRYISPLPASIPRLAGRFMRIIGSDRAADVAASYPSLRLPAIKDRMRKFQAVLTNWLGDAAGAYPYAVGYWLPREVSMLVGSYKNPRPPLKTFSPSLIESMMLCDMKYYLPEDILTKVDRATMFTSLEGRDPFLDHRIIEFALRLPMEFKYRHGQMKYILKKLLTRYMPKHLFTRPKQGFAVPIYTWLHDDLMNLVDEYLSPETLSGQSEIDPGMVLKTVSDFKGKRGSVAVDRIWLLLVFMMWRRRYCGE
jgi:asparagine synthase (glutamine-hydrolysing)